MSVRGPALYVCVVWCGVVWWWREGEVRWQRPEGQRTDNKKRHTRSGETLANVYLWLQQRPGARGQLRRLWLSDSMTKEILSKDRPTEKSFFYYVLWTGGQLVA